MTDVHKPALNAGVLDTCQKLVSNNVTKTLLRNKYLEQNTLLHQEGELAQNLAGTALPS